MRADVQRVNSRRCDKPLVRLTFSDGPVITCTADHKFLPAHVTRRRNATLTEADWVEAQDLPVVPPGASRAAVKATWGVAMDVQGTQRFPLSEADRAWVHDTSATLEPLKMGTPDEVARTCAFTRLAGFSRSGGSLRTADAHVRLRLAKKRDVNEARADWKLRGLGSRSQRCRRAGALRARRSDARRRRRPAVARCRQEPDDATRGAHGVPVWRLRWRRHRAVHQPRQRQVHLRASPLLAGVRRAAARGPRFVPRRPPPRARPRGRLGRARCCDALVQAP